MAAVDGEIDAASAADREHPSTCLSCRQWLSDLEQMDGRLQRLAYPDARIDLWAPVESRIRAVGSKPNAARGLWIIGSLVLAWRGLQLLIDLPFPVLHPLVPFAVAAAALWLLAGDALSIKTFAPELQKRGV
jgi:hypothetical protein